MNECPDEIENFNQTLLRLKGIKDVRNTIDDVEDITGKDLSRSDLSHLPIATLLRTNGGMEDESIVQFEFAITNTQEGLISLEFLSWFVKDQAKGGVKIQLRTLAFPPETPTGRQLGKTLRFHIDFFITGVHETLDPVLKEIKKLNESLTLFMNLYNIPTNNSSNP
jgi:hypothetical protein